MVAVSEVSLEMVVAVKAAVPKVGVQEVAAEAVAARAKARPVAATATAVEATATTAAATATAAELAFQLGREGRAVAIQAVAEAARVIAEEV